MHYKVFELKVASPPEKVWEFHSSGKSLELLAPPGKRVKLISPDLEMNDGTLQVMRMWILGILPITWRARISQVTPPYGFTDQAEKSPFKFWRHRHDFIPDGDGTLIRDMVAYILPMGKLGKVINKLYVEKDLDRIFAYRHEAFKRILGESAPDTP